MFSVIGLGYMNFFIAKVLQVLYFSSNAIVKAEILEEGVLGSFIFNFALPVNWEL